MVKVKTNESQWGQGGYAPFQFWQETIYQKM
jgi:hypothetical protein